MDGSGGKQVRPKVSWAFMVEHMPNVVAKLREKRARGEGAHIDLCWSRGVVGLEPDWFWGYEAGVAVGVLGPEMAGDPQVQQVLREFPGLNILVLREKPEGGADGAH